MIRNLCLPSGCGDHNAIETWRGLKDKIGFQVEDPYMASVSVIAAYFGVDFISYESIENASTVFPVVVIVDATLGYLSFKKGSDLNLPISYSR